jgi:site-specific DNA recombinase
MKTAVLYTRFGSSEQANKNRGANNLQEQQLKKYCEKENIKIVRIYNDVGSGASFDRPEFNRFIKELKKGTVAADLFLFTSIDRFSRNIQELYHMHHRLVALGITPKSIAPVNVVFVEISHKK